MRIKLWTWSHAEERLGPYLMLDVIERPEPLSVGEDTGYGKVVSVIPPIAPFTDDADQSVVVDSGRANEAELHPGAMPDALPEPYRKITILPIEVDHHAVLEPDAIRGAHMVLADQSLSIEDISPLLLPDTFSTWKQGCFLAKRDAEKLQGLDYALTHRYSAHGYREGEGRSKELLDLADACLSLIRPTRKYRVRIIHGLVKENETLAPHGFGLGEFVEVPLIQRLFSIRTQDVHLLQQILPRFIDLYRKDDSGRIREDYEPVRMAVQLYQQAYANSYWKARHILWWSAIEALYGNAEDSVMARVYAFFGDKDLVRGYETSIYEQGDIPSCYSLTSNNNHTLGEVLPLIYEVRNSAAHGQKVADPNFVPVPHPFGGTAPLLDVLAEAATFIIRKSVVAILSRGICEEFTDREARERFWLNQYGLDNRQSKKRLHALKEAYPTATASTT